MRANSIDMRPFGELSHESYAANIIPLWRVVFVKLRAKAHQRGGWSDLTSVGEIKVYLNCK